MTDTTKKLNRMCLVGCRFTDKIGQGEIRTTADRAMSVVACEK